MQGVMAVPPGSRREAVQCGEPLALSVRRVSCLTQSNWGQLEAVCKREHPTQRAWGTRGAQLFDDICGKYVRLSFGFVFSRWAPPQMY